MTWNTAPTADTTLLASLGAVSVNTWYEVDITSLITGDGTYSLRISDSTGGADYYSKEGANPPELLITLGGTPAPSATPTVTPAVTASQTPTITPTPSNTPSGATAIPSCSQVSHGPLTFAGNTMSMTITNPTGVALVMQNVTVTWNHDKGHMTGIDKTLRLQQASLTGVTLWSGDNAGWTYTISTNASIPTGTSTITFTFDKSYDNADGTERILINLATNGCQSSPIDSNPPATATPTNPPYPTPPPSSTFSSAAFTYNGDGQRVKSEMTTNLGTTTTYFVGAHYEVTDGVVTKYYYAGAQRIAMRSSGTLYFMLGDHLGSTSLTTFANGNVVSETRYKAWGEVRYASGTVPTKYQYTGQYSYQSDFGLMFYNARWYDSSLSRFAQADTVIPEGVQGYDHYAYTNNNPLRYTDPTGHRNCEEDGYDCEGRGTYVLAAINYHKEGFIDHRLLHILRLQDEYDSIGPAQVSDIEMETPYGEEVPEKNPRKTGLGLRDGPCTFGCTMDQDDPDVAVRAMRTRLNLRLDVCVQAGCTTTDMFIVAALSADEQIAPSVLQKAFDNRNYKSSDPQTTLVDWQKFINANWDQNGHDHNIDLIHKFQSEVLKLQQQNHYAPDVNGAYLTGLK